MKRLAAVALLLAAFVVAITPAGDAQEPCRSSIRTIDDCPLEGCGGRRVDPELNKKKNRTARPAANRIEPLTLGQIRALRPPTSWRTGDDRAPLARFEDRAVVVTAFLHDARKSGPESTNCKLRKKEFNDIHLDLVSRPNDIRETSVTAEITPRLRPEGWDFEKLDWLEDNKSFVRVTGWLMYDTMHITRPLRRATNIEIHPVTRFEVCTGRMSECRNGRGWTRLEDYEIPDDEG